MTTPCRLCTNGEIVGRASTVETLDGRTPDENVPCPVCSPRGADMARDVRVSLIADLADELANRLQPGVVIDADDARTATHLRRLLADERAWSLGLI